MLFVCMISKAEWILRCDFLGRAASGGAPEPPRATRSPPESIRTDQETHFFDFCRVHPGKVHPWKDDPGKDDFGEKVEFSRLNSKQKVQKK